MAAHFEHRHCVRPDEIDVQGHANNVVYVAWMQDAAIAHTAALGWPSERYVTLGSGWVARSHTIEYLQQAFAGDEIVVETWIAWMKRASSLRRYRIRRAADGVPLAQAETLWAFIDFATGQPTRIPAEIRDAFPSGEPDPSTPQTGISP